jgi:methyl-accepting chemotaxis protein
MISLRNEITNVARNANSGASGIQKFAKNVLQLAGIGSVYMTLQKMVNVTKELATNVMELDSAMISLQRVSSGTATTYEDFKNNMFQVADVVGSTATDMVKSAKEFAQLGYSLEEAGVLAENASKLATAGEMTIDEALKKGYNPVTKKFEKSKHKENIDAAMNKLNEQDKQRLMELTDPANVGLAPADAEQFGLPNDSPMIKQPTAGPSPEAAVPGGLPGMGSPEQSQGAPGMDIASLLGGTK